MMTMKMFTVNILLINMQLDQNIVMTCTLHSLLPLTHTTKEMKIVLGEDENKFGHELDSDIPDNSDEIEHTNVIKLQNGLGKMRKRKKSSNTVAQLQH